MSKRRYLARFCIRLKETAVKMKSIERALSIFLLAGILFALSARLLRHRARPVRPDVHEYDGRRRWMT